jgi:hypothetical protein
MRPTCIHVLEGGSSVFLLWCILLVRFSYGAPGECPEFYLVGGALQKGMQPERWYRSCRGHVRACPHRRRDQQLFAATDQGASHMTPVACRGKCQSARQCITRRKKPACPLQRSNSGLVLVRYLRVQARTWLTRSILRLWVREARDSVERAVVLHLLRGY